MNSKGNCCNAHFPYFGCIISKSGDGQINGELSTIGYTLCPALQIIKYAPSITCINGDIFLITNTPQYSDKSIIVIVILQCLLSLMFPNWRIYCCMYDLDSSAPRITGREGTGGFAGTEFNVDYDFSALMSRGVNPYQYFSSLESELYDGHIGSTLYNGSYVPVMLRSSNLETFDLWNMENAGITVDSTRVKMSEAGKIEKRRTGLRINKNNQSYEIVVGFNFIGSYELAKKFITGTVERLNDKTLPVGYKAESLDFGAWWQAKNQYASLLFLIAAVIFVICSMLFESLRLPFAVIMMIPVSFIGMFLTFGLSDFVFDQGGFAAMVMLCGIAVNAAIYIINEYKTCLPSGKPEENLPESRQVKAYVKAFNHKIRPILLTVISSVLGLVPFLFDGPEEVFWFPFAVGVISGLVFSLAAILFYLPLFSVRVRHGRPWGASRIRSSERRSG